MLERSEGLTDWTKHYLQEMQGIRPHVSGRLSDQSTQLGHLSHLHSHHWGRSQTTKTPSSLGNMGKLCFYYTNASFKLRFICYLEIFVCLNFKFRYFCVYKYIYAYFCLIILLYCIYRSMEYVLLLVFSNVWSDSVVGWATWSRVPTLMIWILSIYLILPGALGRLSL
jgi:hypothetical protein